ncbi:nucleolar rRNA processing protein, putative [Plasmodium vinckei brucechwatti]|uniref:U3 small nucleolar RNA-associated protein 11 n=1 Tax=Plasmodium vinckei brucechwatti TaxID=119398 RepID=A0A6V7T4T3_PLAVN|nr:nucleolar rRNA processing protein, putative [Plasmodium vinckei brucechwatti]
MSSLKNIIPKRNYRERGQAKNRLHLGELEKKADYSKRREIYKKKQKIENVLKEKIMNKNPDEFNTGMVHSRVNEKENVLVKEEIAIPENVKLKNIRNKLKTEENYNYTFLKRINKKINNYQMNIPLRYVFNNTHEFYNDNDEKYDLKTENNKLKRKGQEFEKKFKSLLNAKKNVLEKIRKIENSFVNTYKDIDGYKIYSKKGGVPYRFVAPRLR